MDIEKRWFIVKEEGKYKTRWIHTILLEDADDYYVVVSMDDIGNNPTRNSIGNNPTRNSCRIEDVFISDCFKTKRDAQMEIILQERFYPKN